MTSLSANISYSSFVRIMQKMNKRDTCIYKYGDVTKTDFRFECFVEKLKTDAKFVALFLVLAFIIIFTLTVNLMILFSIFFEKKRKRVDVCFFSNAIADLLMGLIIMPITAIYVLFGHFPLGEYTCLIWNSVDFSAGTISMLHIAFISYDRYLSVYKPLQYTQKKSDKCSIIGVPTWIVLLLIWTFGCIAWIPLIIYLKSKKEEKVLNEFSNRTNVTSEYLLSLSDYGNTTTISQHVNMSVFSNTTDKIFFDCGVEVPASIVLPHSVFVYFLPIFLILTFYSRTIVIVNRKMKRRQSAVVVAKSGAKRWFNMNEESPGDPSTTQRLVKFLFRYKLVRSCCPWEESDFWNSNYQGDTNKNMVATSETEESPGEGPFDASDKRDDMRRVSQLKFYIIDELPSDLNRSVCENPDEEKQPETKAESSVVASPSAESVKKSPAEIGENKPRLVLETTDRNLVINNTNQFEEHESSGLDSAEKARACMAGEFDQILLIDEVSSDSSASMENFVETEEVEAGKSDVDSRRNSHAEPTSNLFCRTLTNTDSDVNDAFLDLNVDQFKPLSISDTESIDPEERKPRVNPESEKKSRPKPIAASRRVSFRTRSFQLRVDINYNSYKDVKEYLSKTRLFSREKENASKPIVESAKLSVSMDNLKKAAEHVEQIQLKEKKRTRSLKDPQRNQRKVEKDEPVPTPVEEPLENGIIEATLGDNEAPKTRRPGFNRLFTQSLKLRSSFKRSKIRKASSAEPCDSKNGISGRLLEEKLNRILKDPAEAAKPDPASGPVNSDKTEVLKCESRKGVVFAEEDAAPAETRRKSIVSFGPNNLKYPATPKGTPVAQTKKPHSRPSLKISNIVRNSKASYLNRGSRLSANHKPASLSPSNTNSTLSVNGGILKKRHYSKESSGGVSSGGANTSSRDNCLNNSELSITRKECKYSNSFLAILDGNREVKAALSNPTIKFDETSINSRHCLTPNTARKCSMAGDKRGSVANVSVATARTTASSRSKASAANIKRERYVTYKLGIIMVAFIICWSPFCFFWALSSVCTTCIPEKLYIFSFWLAYLNSTFTPVILLYTNSKYRKSVQVINRIFCRPFGIYKRDKSTSSDVNQDPVSFQQSKVNRLNNPSYAGRPMPSYSAVYQD